MINRKSPVYGKILLMAAALTALAIPLTSAGASLGDGGFKIRATNDENSEIYSIRGSAADAGSNTTDPEPAGSKYDLEISYTLRCDADTEFISPSMGDRDSYTNNTAMAFGDDELQDVSWNISSTARTLKAGETYKLTVAGTPRLLMDRYGNIYGTAASCYRSIDSIKTSKDSVDLSALALGLTNLESVPTEVPPIDGISSAFQQTTNLSSDLSGWDVSRVKNFYGAFYKSRNFSADVSSWDTRSAESIERMLYDAKGFTSDLSNWDTSKVLNMRETFSFSDFDGDISDWDVSSVRDFQFMFHIASKFQGIGLEKWKPSNAENMNAMFQQVPNLKTDFTSWGQHTGRVKNMDYMFNNTSAKGVFTDWDVSSVTKHEWFGGWPEPRWVS